MTDLFDHYDILPEPVKQVLESINEDADYADLNEANLKLNEIGYCFEYGLDAIPYNLKKI